MNKFLSKLYQLGQDKKIMNALNYKVSMQTREYAATQSDTRIAYRIQENKEKDNIQSNDTAHKYQQDTLNKQVDKTKTKIFTT